MKTQLSIQEIADKKDREIRKEQDEFSNYLNKNKESLDNDNLSLNV